MCTSREVHSRDVIHSMLYVHQFVSLFKTALVLWSVSEEETMSLYLAAPVKVTTVRKCE